MILKQAQKERIGLRERRERERQIHSQKTKGIRNNKQTLNKNATKLQRKRNETESHAEYDTIILAIDCLVRWDSTERRIHLAIRP